MRDFTTLSDMDLTTIDGSSLGRGSEGSSMSIDEDDEDSMEDPLGGQGQ